MADLGEIESAVQRSAALTEAHRASVKGAVAQLEGNPDLAVRILFDASLPQDKVLDRYRVSALNAAGRNREAIRYSNVVCVDNNALDDAWADLYRDPEAAIESLEGLGGEEAEEIVATVKAAKGDSGGEDHLRQRAQAGEVSAGLNLSWTLSLAERHPERVEVMKRLLTLRPNHPTLWVEAAQAYRTMGQSQEARSFLAQAPAKARESFAVRSFGSIADVSDQRPSGIVELSRLVDEYPESISLTMILMRQMARSLRFGDLIRTARNRAVAERELGLERF